MTYKLSASYSILSMWEQALNCVDPQMQIKLMEKTIKAYFKLEYFETEAMRRGKEIHKEFEEYVKKYKKVPEVFYPNRALTNPIIETRLEMRINDEINLVGVPDCIDGSTIFDWKTGITKSSSYSESKQAGIYGLLCLNKDIFAETFEFCHYDQYSKSSDITKTYLSEDRLAQAFKWVTTLAPDLHHYLINQGLYEKYQENREKNSTH